MKIHGTDMEIHGAEKQSEKYERTCLDYVDSLAKAEATAQLLAEKLAFYRHQVTGEILTVQDITEQAKAGKLK